MGKIVTFVLNGVIKVIINLNISPYSNLINVIIKRHLSSLAKNSMPAW
jgi:hypothetical protein